MESKGGQVDLKQVLNYLDFYVLMCWSVADAFDTSCDGWISAGIDRYRF